MPKAPVLSRELFFDRLPDGTYRDLDWALVNTSLGAMVEPVCLSYAGLNRITQIDQRDMSFTSRRELDEDQMFSLLGTAGQQLPADFNT